MSAYNPHFTSYCVTHIDLSALQHNYSTVLSRLPKNSQVMAILKSDAYGHGLLQAAKALDSLGAPSFGVGTVYEGKALRDAGFNQDILILLGAQTAEEMQLCADLNLINTVYSQRALQLTVAVSKPIRVAIKCETGMSRLGFLPEDLPHVLETLQNNPHIDVAMATTHLSCADMPEKESLVRQQVEDFKNMSAVFAAHYPQMQRSLCNTAGALAYSELSASIDAHIYRLGIGLYGSNPLIHSIWESKGTGLKEAMRISSSIIHTFTAKKGQNVGYGATYIVPKDMRIAVLGIGYADGFSRALSQKNSAVHVCIQKQAAPVCGRVCMGTMMVDVSHIPNVKEGDTAWIVNAEIGEDFSMQTLAEIWGTLTHEGFCLFGDNTRTYE